MLLELPLHSRIRREKSERGRLSSPTGAKREPYNYVESFDKAAIRHSTILHCEETLADSTLNSALVGDLSFPGSVETEEALWSVSLLLEIGLCRQESYCEETNNIVAHRIAFYACQKEFEDRYHDFV